MKKLLSLATVLCLLLSAIPVVPVLPVSAAGIEENLVTHWDFAGDDPLADKATAGTTSDTLYVAETDTLKIDFTDGIATIPAGSTGTFLYAMASNDLLSSTTMPERTIFMAVKLTGSLTAGNIELMSQNGGARILIDKNDSNIKGSITTSNALGTDPFWPVQQKLSAGTMLYIALSFKYIPANGNMSAGYQMTSYLSTDGGQTYTVKTANGGFGKAWGTLASGMNMTTLSLGRNVSLHQASDTVNNVVAPQQGGGHTGTVIAFDDVRIYNKVLTEAEVKSIAVTNPAPTPPAPEYDYTATLTGPATGVTVGDNVTFKVNVDNTFAAGKVILNYDPELLTPVAGEGIKIGDGTVTVVTYGADKTSVNVVFEAKAAGTAQVALKEAAFSAKEDAASEDLTDAAIETSEASVVIAPAEFAVTLPEIFEGNSAVANGNDYTFTAKDTNNYNYALPTATVGGEAVTVIDNEDGTYTVKNITGALVITGTRTEKTYNATVTGNGAEDVTLPEAKPTYGTDYVLTLPVTNENYTYTITVQVGNGEAIPVTSATYTIAGADITGDIVVNVTKTEIVPETVTVTLAGNANDAVVGFVGTVNKGDAYTLTVNPVKGYTYTVTATMGGETVTLDTSVANAYTIAAATADIEFTVTATLDKSGVSVNKYVQLDGTTMWLVTVDTELVDGKTYTYGGNTMYYSEAYGAYVYLVVARDLTADTAKAAVDATTGTAASFATDVAYDVNKSGKLDANDAQLVYNMYNAVYSDFTADVTLEKFLLADANADGIVDTADAVKIVDAILNPTR